MVEELITKFNLRWTLGPSIIAKINAHKKFNAAHFEFNNA